MIMKIARSGLVVGIVATVAFIAMAQSARANDPYLRETVEVDGPHVTLGDLFGNPGTVGDIPGMRSPAPGENILLAIDDAFELANANGLGWRPVAPFTHTAITRAWRIIERAEIVAALEPALAAYGAGHNLTIDIPRSASTVKIARGAIAELAIEDLVYDPGTGRFRATLVVRDSFGKARRDALFGSAISYIELPVLRARLRRDHVISDSDVVWQSFRVNRVPSDALIDPAAMIGLSPARSVTPGKPVLASDLRAPTIVKKGAVIAMRLTTRNMRLIATGRALESGALGDLIQVRNTQSKLVVDAIVTGTERVSVTSNAYEVLAQ